MFLKKIAIILMLIIGFNSNIKAQIPTTDIIVVLEELLGLSMEGTELYQKFNDIKTQIAQFEQGLEGNAELQRAADMIRQYSPILQSSKLNDFEKLTALVSGFQEFGASGGLDGVFGDLLDIDPQTIYEGMSCGSFEGMSSSQKIESYKSINNLSNGIADNTRKMQIQTALSYFELSEVWKEKAMELDMLLNSSTNRSFTAEGTDLGFSSITGLFESLSGLMPGPNGIKKLIQNGFGLANLGDKIANGLNNIFSSDPDIEDLDEEQVAIILEEYPEFDYDLDGQLDNEEYIAIVEFKTEELVEEMEEREKLAGDLMDDVLGGVSNMSSIIGSFTIEGEEASLIATDAERIRMMKDRDDYMSKYIEYQEKGAELMAKASELTDTEIEQKNYTIIKQVNTGLSALGKIGS